MPGTVLNVLHGLILSSLQPCRDSIILMLEMRKVMPGEARSTIKGHNDGKKKRTPRADLRTYPASPHARLRTTEVAVDTEK